MEYICISVLFALNPFGAVTACKRQTLTSSKNGPRSEKNKYLQWSYTHNIYDDFKLKKPFGFHGLYTNISAL